MTQTHKMVQNNDHLMSLYYGVLKCTPWKNVIDLSHTITKKILDKLDRK